MVAGAVIEVVAGMGGDGSAVVATAPGIRLRSRAVSALMFRRGRMMGMRIG